MESKDTVQPQAPLQNSGQSQPVLSNDQPKQFRKITIILGIIFALLAFGVGGYFLGVNKNQTSSQPQQAVAQPTDVQSSPTHIPTPTENTTTSNWKTYTNPLGYTFKYPEKIESETIFLSEGTNGAVSLSNVKGTPIPVGVAPRYISIHQIDSTTNTVDEYINSVIEVKKDLKQIDGTQEYTFRERPDKFKTLVLDNIKREPVNIAEVEGERVTGLYLPSMNDSMNIIFAYKNKLWEISLDPYLGTSDKWLANFNQILLIFKFTN